MSLTEGKQGLVEDMLQMLFRECHLTPKELFVVVHNVFVFGEVMDDLVDFTDDKLEQTFDCFDKLIALF